VTIGKITVINLRSTFDIKYCKKTFLNSDFCNFRAWFDSVHVIDSCDVIVEHCLARRYAIIGKITVIILRNMFYIKYCKKTFLYPVCCNFRAWCESFDVSDSCHVIVEHYLARRHVIIVKITVKSLKTLLKCNSCKF